MAKSVSHPISTRDSNISPRADIGRGLIWGVIQISPCIVVFIIYLNFLIRIELLKTSTHLKLTNAETTQILIF